MSLACWRENCVYLKCQVYKVMCLCLVAGQKQNSDSLVDLLYITINLLNKIVFITWYLKINK